jgi:tetratricopeptide (TPR) repeat protein/O-antigen ligase
MQARLESVPARFAVIWTRRGLSWGEVAILLALVYFTPIGGTRAGTFHFPLVLFSHLLAIGVLLAWVVYRLRQGRWLPKTPLDLPLIVFYLVSLISTLFSAEPRLSLENLIHLTLFVLIYYLVVDLLLSGWTVSTVIRPMLVIGSVIILIELLELALWLGIWYVGTGEVSPLLTLGQYRRRIIMGPANVLAWYLVLLMPLALSQLMTASSLKARVNLGAWIAGGSLVFASTLSRSGLVGMAAALATYGLLITISRLRSTSGGGRSLVRRPTVMASMVLTALAVIPLGALAVRLVSTRLYTVEVRFELWRVAAEIITRHPLLGGGPGTFGYLFHQIPDFNPSLPDTFYNNAHNSYINVGAESGLPSVLAGLWLMALLLRTSLRGGQEPNTSSAYPQSTNHACLAGIAGLLAAMVFDVPWVFPVITLYVVLLAAIIVTPYSLPRQSAPRALRWLPTTLVGATTVVLLWSDTAHYFQHRAIIALKRDDLPAAIHSLERSTVIDPFLSIYGFQLGIAKGYHGLETGDIIMLDEAIEAFEEEISRGGDTAINNANLAWLEWSAGNGDSAIDHMQRAARLAPMDGYHALGLGYLLEEAGQPEAAVEAYTAAIKRTPSLADSGYWQANASRQSFKANSLADETLPALTTATLAYSLHDYDTALQALDRRSSSVSADILRGQIETARGEHDEALEHLNTALAKAGQHPAVFLARGKLFLQSGDEANARHDLRIASLLGLSEAGIAFGEIAYQNGDLQKAIRLYQASIPTCHQPSAGYDYASHVYHRPDLKADFWPDMIVCLPYDRLVPEYLHFAGAYRQTGQSQEADDLCIWLREFYEPSVLRHQYDEDSDGWPCPEHTS